MNDKKRYSLAIPINNIAYDVKGIGINDHRNFHAEENFCNALRIANVNCKIKKHIKS